jgi:putative ATPase
MVSCPICGKSVNANKINDHIDSGCESHIENGENGGPSRSSTPVSSFFKTPVAKKDPLLNNGGFGTNGDHPTSSPSLPPLLAASSKKRSFAETTAPPTTSTDQNGLSTPAADQPAPAPDSPPPRKKPKLAPGAPLPERMRPHTLDDIAGQQSLIGPSGLLRGLIESNTIPSLILWGPPGTGKTTIARIIASTANSRFVEINSTSTGVGELKKLFGEAKNESGLTGRRTILFCDEIHRFSRSQQDVFLGPVEKGEVTLVGATTENPSFKMQGALLSRCRVFILESLTPSDIETILTRALSAELDNTDSNLRESAPLLSPESELIPFLCTTSTGDARTALNLLALTLSLLATNPELTLAQLKPHLTKTLLYDRAGDAHYNAISAFHKSIRGSSADGALYYLALMLQSGEDPLYIARRMIVIASEDIGLADNSMLSLATAAHTAVEKVGLPEARINLAHCAVALALAPKSTRSYRGLAAAMHAVGKEEGVMGLKVPPHLCNAPTRLLKDMGVGKGYKYNPDYVGGRVKQEYLPPELEGRVFLEDDNLPGSKGVDEDLEIWEREEVLAAEEERVGLRRRAREPGGESVESGVGVVGGAEGVNGEDEELVLADEDF